MFPRLLFQGCAFSSPPHSEPSDANATLDETSTILKEIDNLMGEFSKKAPRLFKAFDVLHEFILDV